MRSRGLSASTIKHAHAVVSAALTYAKRHDMVATNPARDLELPHREKRERRILTAPEMGRFLAAVQGDRYGVLFLLLAGTGLRPSEALGLRWDLVDVDVGWIRVEKALVRLRKGGVEPLELRNLSRRHFKPALKAAGCPTEIQLRDFRAWHATHGMEQEGEAKAMAARMGHASAKMTLDTYQHALPAQHEAVVDHLERVLRGEDR